ncbi:MAG: YcxB family protein [Lachnospiraceae bacterium]|nr:YcxB family protein [Lachnospiraceae bacterium]
MAKLMYENKFILTRKLHSQYFRYCYRKLQKQTRILALVLTIIFAVCFVLSLILLGSRLIASLFAVLALYFFFMIFFGYSFREWIDYRKLQSDHGDVIVEIVKFNADNIHVKVNETGFSFNYRTIERVYETEDEYILILNLPGMIEHGQVLFKKGFKDGTDVDAFKAYINRRSGKVIFEDKEKQDLPEEKGKGGRESK